MSKTNKNVLFVGVGGQGILLAGKVLAAAAMESKLDVKLSEVHGMAQRGGSVVTMVRYGEKVYSPLVKPGEVDVIVSFEKLEALRWLEYLRPEGAIVLGDAEIEPLPVVLGAQKYPDNAVDLLQNTVQKFVLVDAVAEAKKIGNAKAANILLIGTLASKLNLSKESWEKAIRASVPEMFVDVNLKAFEVGYNLV